jgi:hypothetical protein
VSTGAAFLLIVGALVELAGIVLVGSPDLFPQAQRVSEWLRLRVRRAYNRVMRLLGRPVVHTVSLGAALSASGGVRARGIVSVAADASVEDKIAFLLRREEQTQGRLDDLTEALQALRDDLASGLSEQRTSMEAYVADALSAAHQAYLPLRLLGVVLLTVGLGCVTAASFVA